MKRDLNVLIITSILPIPFLDHKKDENDILLITEDHIKKSFNDIKFNYLYTVPYSNFLLSLVSRKWKQYYRLIKKKRVKVRGREIEVMPFIQLPFRTIFDPILWKLSLFLCERRIVQVVKNEGINMIHSHNSVLDGFIGRKLSDRYKIPYIITDRGVRNYNKISKVVCNNWGNASSIISLSTIGQEKIPIAFRKNNLVISHGIDPELYVTKDLLVRKFSEGRAESDLNKKIKLVSVGRLMKSKNFETLIKAMVDLENFELDIFGRGTERPHLESLIYSLNLEKRVRLKGFVENSKLLPLMNEYDVFALLSFKESFGRVYLEAMARGLIIVCSKGTGFESIIEHGRQGFVLEAEDIDGYIRQLKELRNNGSDRLNKMSLSAYEKAQEYNWVIIADKIYSLYNKLHRKED